MSFEKYKSYRKINKSLHSKIIQKYITKQNYQKAARLLGISLDKNRVFFESEEEVSYVMDFAIYDVQNRGKNLVQRYQKDIDVAGKAEEDVLDAMSVSHTSLFRVEKTSTASHTVLLHDVLNDSKVRIFDYHLALSMQKGCLVFCRIIAFDGFAMTSGIEFAFPPEIEGYLLRQYGVTKKKMKRHSEKITRFAAFFALNRTDGIDVLYADPQ